MSNGSLDPVYSPVRLFCCSFRSFQIIFFSFLCSLVCKLSLIRWLVRSFDFVNTFNDRATIRYRNNLFIAWVCICWCSTCASLASVHTHTHTHRFFPLYIRLFATLTFIQTKTHAVYTWTSYIFRTRDKNKEQLIWALTRNSNQFLLCMVEKHIAHYSFLWITWHSVAFGKGEKLFFIFIHSSACAVHSVQCTVQYMKICVFKSNDGYGTLEKRRKWTRTKRLDKMSKSRTQRDAW